MQRPLLCVFRVTSETRFVVKVRLISVLKPKRVVWIVLLLSQLTLLGFLFPSVNTFHKIPSAQFSAPSKLIAPKAAGFDINKYSIDDPASLWVVVNKNRPLRTADYVPKNLVLPNYKNPNIYNPKKQVLDARAADAMVEMAKAASDAGVGNLVLSSTYRSFVSQTTVHNQFINRLGLTGGEALAARPGYSEHQTGLAADIVTPSQGCLAQPCYAGTSAGSWLAENSYKFGWVLRYPNELTFETGYHFEPWHYRYVGKELAAYMHANKLKTLEEVFGLPWAPDYSSTESTNALASI